MPEHHEPDTGSKSKTYQSIAVYDGSDPAYFKNWHAKVLSHYATWLNGEDRAGHWKQHLVSDGCFIDMPSSDLDDRYLKLFRPHLAADKISASNDEAFLEWLRFELGLNRVTRVCSTASLAGAPQPLYISPIMSTCGFQNGPFWGVLSKTSALRYHGMCGVKQRYKSSATRRSPARSTQPPLMSKS